MTPMKSIHRIFALAALAATASLSPALHAQVNDAMRVNVPFAFNCGAQHFTAGSYTVRMLNSNVLVVSSYAKTVYAMTESGSEGRGKGDGYLIFRKYGNRYFLGEYHPANSLTAALVFRSKTERSLARDFASNQADQGRVRLALVENGNGVSAER